MDQGRPQHREGKRNKGPESFCKLIRVKP
uniref:Uncharacterized protein n=1 Tax=Anguilla anguilla TaxID=7936 RepID=A0A0E9SU52_ANGAN